MQAGRRFANATSIPDLIWSEMTLPASGLDGAANSFQDVLSELLLSTSATAD